MTDFFKDSKNVIALHLDKNGLILSSNYGFKKLFKSHPLNNVSLKEFFRLNTDSNNMTLENIETLLNRTVELFSILGQEIKLNAIISSNSSDYTFIGEIQNFDNIEMITKMSRLTSELSSTLRDIHKKNNALSSAKKKIEEAYRLFDNGRLLVFKWKNEKDWPVEYISKSSENILGYKGEDFLNSELKYLDLIHPLDVSKVVKKIEEDSYKRLKSIELEDYRIKKSDNNYIWVHDTREVIYDEKNEITHYIGYLLDVSDQKIKSYLNMLKDLILPYKVVMMAYGILI